jgi:hypothetical protein
MIADRFQRTIFPVYYLPVIEGGTNLDIQQIIPNLSNEIYFLIILLTYE